jgi:hypothetical protein
MVPIGQLTRGRACVVVDQNGWLGTGGQQGRTAGIGVDVGLHRLDAGTGGQAQGFCGPFQLVGVSAIDGDVAAFLRQRERTSVAQTL